MNDKALNDLEWALRYNQKQCAHLAPKQPLMDEAGYMARKLQVKETLEKARILSDLLEGHAK